MAEISAPFVNDPQCGWYKVMLVKGGPYVPAAIYIEREIDPDTGELLTDEIMRCEISGRFHDPEDAWLWCWETPISKAEFDYLKAVAYHAAFHAPDQPEANPRKKIDWLSVEPPKFQQRRRDDADK